MKKLTAVQLKEKTRIVGELAIKEAALAEAIEAYNEAMQTAREEVEVAVTGYNDAVAEANELCSEIVDSIDEYISSRSEKWLESDKASAYETWKDSWNETLEECELEQPDGFEHEGSLSETLEAIPNEVED